MKKSLTSLGAKGIGPVTETTSSHVRWCEVPAAAGTVGKLVIADMPSGMLGSWCTPRSFGREEIYDGTALVFPGWVTFQRASDSQEAGLSGREINRILLGSE